MFDTVPLLQTIGKPIVASYKPMSYIDAVVQFGSQAQVRVPSNCQPRQVRCVHMVPGVYFDSQCYSYWVLSLVHSRCSPCSLPAWD